MNRKGWSVQFAALLAAAACAAVIFLSLHRDPPTSKLATAPPPAPQASDQSPLAPRVDELSGALTIHVGDTALFNGVGFGVINMTAPYTNPAAQPQNGEFVRLDVQVENTAAAGGSPFDVSGAQSFELQDDGGGIYPEARVTGAPQAPEGKVAPGARLQGSLVYDLPAGRTYRLLYKNGQLSNGEIVTELGQI